MTRETLEARKNRERWAAARRKRSKEFTPFQIKQQVRAKTITTLAALIGFLTGFYNAVHHGVWFDLSSLALGVDRFFQVSALGALVIMLPAYIKNRRAGKENL